MTSFSLSSARWIAAALAVAVMAAPASAACRKLAFEVNDYGKEGPTKDALALLDKHIAATMEKEGIKKYKVGKKSVDCKLFLDFIVFDEYTCRAAATVCWNGPLPPGHTVDASAATPFVNKAAQSGEAKPKAATTAAPGTAPAAISTGSVKAAPAAPAAAKAPAAPTAVAPAKPATAPAAN